MLESSNHPEFSPDNELHASITKYADSVKYLTQHFKVRYLGLSDQAGKYFLVYETGMFGVEDPDGSRVETNYSYFPNGIKDFPTLRSTTVVSERVKDLGEWTTNYHMHIEEDSSWVWERVEWFVLDDRVLTDLDAGQDSPPHVVELKEIRGAKAMADDFNTVAGRSHFAAIAEALSTSEITTPDPIGLSLLQGYINQII